jgi:hypothetical protein
MHDNCVQFFLLYICGVEIKLKIDGQRRLSNNKELRVLQLL